MAKHLIDTAVHCVHFTLFFYKMLNEHAENVFPAAGDNLFKATKSLMSKKRIKYSIKFQDPYSSEAMKLGD